MKKLIYLSLVMALVAACSDDKSDSSESNDKQEQSNPKPKIEFEASVCNCNDRISELMDQAMGGDNVEEELAFVQDACAELETELGTEMYMKGIRDCQIANGDSVQTTEVTPCECYNEISRLMDAVAAGEEAVADELNAMDSECGILREMMGDGPYQEAIDSCANL